MSPYKTPLLDTHFHGDLNSRYTPCGKNVMSLREARLTHDLDEVTCEVCLVKETERRRVKLCDNGGPRPL